MHLLGAYADGELSQSEAAKVEAMLRDHADAAAVVSQTQAMRSAVQRSLEAVAVPEDLRASITNAIRTDRRAGRSRTLKLFVSSGFAAAAMVLLSWTVIGQNAEATRVDRPPAIVKKLQASRVAEVYQSCAADVAHDDLGVADRTVASANKVLRTKHVLAPAGPVLPDLDKDGYRLVGACECADGDNVEMLHAAYESKDDATRRLGLFISDTPVRLVCGGTEVASLTETRRTYQLTKLRGGLVVVKWDTRQSSITLCSQMQPAEIVDLAERMDVIRDGGQLAIVLLP